MTITPPGAALTGAVGAVAAGVIDDGALEGVDGMARAGLTADATRCPLITGGARATLDDAGAGVDAGAGAVTTSGGRSFVGKVGFGSSFVTSAVLAGGGEGDDAGKRRQAKTADNATAISAA